MHRTIWLQAFLSPQRSFPKQYYNSQNVAESELDMLEAKSLEGQGALLVLWPQCQKRPSLLVYRCDCSSQVKTLLSRVTPSDFAVVTWLTWLSLIVFVGESVRVLNLCLEPMSIWKFVIAAAGFELATHLCLHCTWSLAFVNCIVGWFTRVVVGVHSPSLHGWVAVSLLQPKVVDCSITRHNII